MPMRSMVEKVCFCFIILVFHMWIWDLVSAETLASKRLFRIAHQQRQQIETIELLFNQNPGFQVFSLKNPSRFVMDLKDCWFDDNVHKILEVGSPSIKRIRISQFRKNVVRVVIDQGMSFLKPEISTREHPMGERILITLASPVENRTAVLTENMGIHTSPAGSEHTGSIDHDETIKKNTNTAHLNTKAGLAQESIDDLFSSSDSGMPSRPLAEKSRTTSVMTINGDLRNQTAYRLKKPHQFSKIKTDFNLNLSGEVSDNLSYVLGTRFSYDAVFDLTDNYNEDVENDQKKRVDLRDAYVDFGWGDADFRIGNQQIVWGQAVGLFFADIVNPKDMRGYILADLDQIRIPVPAVNLEYYPGSLYLQFIFIPYPDFNEFGKKGAEFDFSRAFDAQNADIVVIDPQRPANSLDNSELGFRLSTLIQGWDLSVFYLYDYYNFPVNYRYISVNPMGSVHPVTTTYRPKYERMQRVGYTFSKEYMNAVLKGEFIYNHEMFIASLNPADFDGILKTDTFKWLLGVDYTFFNSLETNIQLMQEIIVDYQKDMTQEEYTTSFSIWMKTGFFENKIEPELFIVSSLNQKDSLFRLKVVYNYNTWLKFICGVDLFHGESDVDFGLFNKNDRGYVEVLYAF